MTNYPHEQWAQRMARSPGVWFDLTHGDPDQDGLMRVMAHRIRTGVLASYRPAGAFDAFYRDGILWGQKIEAHHDES